MMMLLSKTSAHLLLILREELIKKCLGLNAQLSRVLLQLAARLPGDGAHAFQVKLHEVVVAIDGDQGSDTFAVPADNHRVAPKPSSSSGRLWARSD